MAERNILGILILLSLHQTYAALDVFAPSPQKSLMTDHTVLNCTFTVDKQRLDLNFLAILWSFQGKVILRYDNKGFSTQDPRMALNVESLRDGFASLHISNVTISDGGIYKCSVIYSPESKEKEISFEVLAKPLLSILSTKVPRNTENTLTCKATGFFPPDIWITWYRKGNVLGNQVMGKPQMYNDGTYQVDSTMTITPTDDDQNQTFSCRVQHDSLQEPLQMDYQLIIEDIELDQSNVVIVICIVLVLMTIIFGTLIFLWKRKCRKKDMGTFTLLDIEGPTKLIAGEETSLYCKAPNCPENTSVTWLEKKRGGEVYEIPESHGGDKEEEERLMGTQYGVISCREGTNLTSSLKFRPNVTNHKDMTFICRYSRGKEKKEKTFHCRDFYAKPQLVQPISRSLIVSGVLKYLVTLENFYPKDITIRWTRGIGEPQEALPSTETFTDNPDGTHSVYSEVRIPEKLLKDPEFKVRVSWEHQSLDTPGCKDLSVRDSEYPWTPVVEEIQTPNVFHDTPVTLQCNISEYFPDAITVTWLRRSRDGELCEETDNMVTSTITPRREADNTYSCTASLTIIPTLSVHQGAEYICRVDHPSLKKPIEKKTERLAVKGKPQMVEPIMITMGDSSRVLFTLYLQKLYPEKIEIEWAYESKDKKYEITRNNNIQKHKDLTHDVTSVGQIPMYVFDDPQTKVSVTWKHESMDEPETRTLTIRDLPWRPQVGEIIIPNLEEDKEARLTCDISEYFPDLLKVIWYKKEPGPVSPPIVTELPTNAYKVSDKKKKDQKDKTFSYKSSLTFTPSFRRDQGAEFICRVEHPSLEKPIERRTGPIVIDLPWRPQVGEIIIPNLEEDKEACLTCDISGYFPDLLKVIWYKKEPGPDSPPIVTELPTDAYKVSDQKKELKDRISIFEKKDKTFSYKTSLTFTPSIRRDQGAEFICKVEHPTLEHPIERITSLIVIDVPRLQIGEIKISKLEEGKEASLTCEISGYIQDHTIVSWYRELPGTDLHPIITPLPNEDFQMCPKQKKDKIWQSSLIFIPSFSRDRGAEFICRVKHPGLEHPIERRTGTIKIDLPRPQIGEIKIPKLEEGKEASLTCEISRYFQDHMTVSWYRELPGTDLHPIIAPLPNEDFQICTEQKKDKIWQSSLTFIPSFSRDQGAVFICRVEHPGLEKPIERRTGTIKIDLPSPQIGDIKIPELEEGKEATLTCEISDYIQDHTTVSWYRKLTKKDLHPIIATEDFQICTEQKKDKIWQSSLKFTPSFSRDQGAEFICRVEPPGQKKPIEKTTGPIKLREHSMNGTVNAQHNVSS